MAISIFDIVTPGNVIAYYDKRMANQETYMGELLFPATKQLGTELTKIGGHAGVPVELKASAFDVQATFRDRLSVETRTQTMPFFKEGMRVDEKIRQQLLNLAVLVILRYLLRWLAIFLTILLTCLEVQG